MSKRFCVLGGGGSFGLAVSKYLLENSDPEKVIGIGRAQPKRQCFTLNVGVGDPRYEYRAYHVTYELDLLLEYLEQFAPMIVINFCAQGEGATSFDHSWRYFETNCVGLTRLVEELSHRDYVERFVHIGTSELYGSTAHPAKETDVIQPTSPYAVSKAAFDMYLLALHRHSGFPMNIVRPSNAYGPGQQLHRLIPKAILCGLMERKLPLHGGGRVEKTYIHTRDLAYAVDLICRGAPMGEIYNVGSERPIRIRDVVDLVACTLGMPFDELCEVTDDRQHQDACYWLDSSKIRADLGWAPKVSWQKGLQEMVAWARQYLPMLEQLPTEFCMRA